MLLLPLTANANTDRAVSGERAESISQTREQGLETVAESSPSPEAKGETPVPALERPKDEQDRVQSAITKIRLNPTKSGIEAILDASSSAIEPLISTADNKAIVDIPNAVLTGSKFEQPDPAEGISLVTVESVPGQGVRVTIAGTKTAPTVEAKTEGRSLIIRATPGQVAASPPQEQEIDIYVTAQKTPEKPIGVPISLTVLGQDDIKNARIDTIRNVAANTPNFFTTVGDRAFNFYSVRGFSNSNFLIRDSVGFYLDDVPIEYYHQFFPGELSDLDRVEVLRGPQSTLYGRNSIAGVVNIVSRPPSDFPETELGLEYGTYNQRRVRASFSNALVPDKLGIRLSGSYSARDGFTENTLLNRDADSQSSLAGRLNLLWTPNPDWSVSFNLLGASNNDRGTVYSEIGAPDPFKIQENRIADLNVGTNAQSLKVTYNGDNLRFTSITARNSSNVSYISDGDYTADDLYTFSSDISSTLWSQEFRLQSPESAKEWKWLLGAYAQARSFDVNRQQVEYTEVGAALFEIPDVRFGDTIAKYDQTTLAAFGQVDYTPADPLTLSLGLRYEYSRDELERSDRLETFDGISAVSGEVKDSIDGDALLPRFALTYRFSPNTAAYASISRGYRPVTLNYTVPDASLNDVKEESSWNYEIGFKSSWLNDRLFFNVAAFINDINDYQVLLPDSQGFFTNITNAQARVAGFEAEAKAIPLDGLELTAGFGYIDAKYTDYTSPFTGDNFNGNKLPYAPEYTFNLAAQYRSPGGFFSRLELQGLGTYFFDDANSLKQDSLTLVNARIGYEFGKSGLYLFANNLFDKEYFTAAFAPLGVPRANYGDRRVIGIQFQTRF